MGIKMISKKDKKELHIAEDFEQDYVAENKEESRLITVQNIFVAFAAVLFLATQFVEALEAYHTIMHGIAYILGAGAYIMELLILTDHFKRRPSWREMFMPYVFGAIYLILGASYFIRALA